VANVDLWQPLIELVVVRSPRFRWVKGHSGDPMNDLVDALAVAASQGPFAPSPAVAPVPDVDEAQGSLFDG
jgi:ribonuclease HI